MTYRSPFISVQKLFLSIVNFDLGECYFSKNSNNDLGFSIARPFVHVRTVC